VEPLPEVRSQLLATPESCICLTGLPTCPRLTWLPANLLAQPFC